jgi:hypothetical protein
MQKAQLKYLTEVLGVETVLRPALARDDAPEADFLDLAFCVEGDVGAPEKELLQRIISALKLENIKHKTYHAPFDLTQISAGARAVVVFGDRLENPVPNGLGWLLRTHSLRSLARDASLKKSTWTGLQDLVGKAGL